MKSRTHKQDSLVIVYDAERLEQPGPECFDPAWWRERGALIGKAQGRGSAFFLETDFGPAVLRQYLRGGQAARVSRDRYLFTGFERSRPLAEFRVLARLAEDGLPVPRPLAALCRRDGPFYTGWLLTRRIAEALPLADRIDDRHEDADLWLAVGATIRRFHEYGLVHADLNARNILVGAADDIHLIDLDRARLRAGDTRAFQANLRRLRRSLEKLWPAPLSDRLEACWTALRRGYEHGPVR